MAFRKESKVANSNFSKITISLSSPEEILENRMVKCLNLKLLITEHINQNEMVCFVKEYLVLLKDYECHCGKYKRIRYKGIVCDRCGVEVTEKKVRRERMGHIALVVPVAHIWYFRSLPNKIGYLLGLPTKKLDQIIYYERYVVINPAGQLNAEGEELVKNDFLTEEEYLDILEALPKENQYLDDDDANKFVAKMGC